MFKRSYISYIPYSNLKNYLEELLSFNKIDFFMMIKHFGENGGKDHIHLYVESNFKNINDIVTSYVMYNVNGALKTSFSKKSDLSNWYWYVLHNSEYLMKKGLSKEYYYESKDIYVSDYTYLLESIKDLRGVNVKNEYILKCLKEGEKPISLFKRGVVSLYELRLLELYYKRI